MKNIKLSKLKQQLLFLIILFSIMTTFDISILRLYKRVSILFLPILIFILLDKNKINKYIIKDFVWLYGFMLIALIQVFFTPQIGFGAYYTYSMLICIFISVKEIRLNCRQMNIIYCASFVVYLKYIFLAKGYGEMHYASVVNNDYSYINTNVISFMISLLCMFLWIEIDRKIFINKYIRKLTKILIIIGSLYVTNNLQSRSSYIAIIIFAGIMYFIKKDFLTRKNVLFLLYLILVIGSFLVPIIYIYMYENNINISSIGSINKSTFTGREIIWKNLFATFREFPNINFLLGLGSKHELNSLGADMHNNSMSILKNYGVVGICLLYGFIGTKIKRNKCINRESLNFLIAFLCSLIIGYFETLLAFTPAAIIMMLFLGCAIQNNSVLIRRYNEVVYKKV